MGRAAPLPLAIVRNPFARTWADAIGSVAPTVVLTVETPKGDTATDVRLTRVDTLEFHMQLPVAARRGPLDRRRRTASWIDAFDQMTSECGPIDLVHEHFSNNAWAARAIARRRGVRYVVTEHSSTYSGQNPDRALPRNLIRKVRRNLGDAAGLIVVTPSIETAMRKHSLIADSTLVECINNPVAAAFAPAANATAHPPADPPVIVTVARLAPEKDLSSLLHALRELQRRGRPFQARIIGDGPLGDELRRQADDLGIAHLVTFVGRLAPEAVADQLGQADLFALPSLWENDPVALREALVCGLPVVASAVGGVPAIVNERNGVLVPPSDPTSLADAIQAALDGLGQFDRRAISVEALRTGAAAEVGARVWQFYDRLRSLGAVHTQPDVTRRSAP